MYTVTIVGVGRIGGAFALALPASKYLVERLVVRDPERWRAENVRLAQLHTVTDIATDFQVRSDFVIIATQDSEITPAAELLSGRLDSGTAVFHTSGSLSSAVLGPISRKGYPTGSIHPLVSVSDPTLGAERFAGAYFCIEGDSAAIDLASEIVNDLGGKPFTIDTEMKSLYHAAAVMACGHLVALIDAAIELITKCGPDPEFAKTILLPLVESTVRNLGRQEPAAALTGTFARGDIETFERHLAALNKFGTEQLLDIYLELGERSLDLALKNGTDPEAIQTIRDRIMMAKS